MSIEERVAQIEKSLATINFELGKLVGQQRTTAMLIKWVVLPLLAIIGGLVGVRIALPGI